MTNGSGHKLPNSIRAQLVHQMVKGHNLGLKFGQKARSKKHQKNKREVEREGILAFQEAPSLGRLGEQGTSNKAWTFGGKACATP